MGEEHHKPIPVLDDVVEIGQSDNQDDSEESIRIVADKALEDEFDDPYDDEFKKLFDNATRPDDDAEMPEPQAVNPSPQTDSSPPAMTATPQAAAGDEVSVTASRDDNQPGEDDELWLSDWQEDTSTRPVAGQLDESGETELDILHSQAEIEISDEETAALITAAVDEDDTPPQTDHASGGRTAAPLAAVNTGELVNQIVRELMPEIEWKLRTRIREVLEQHFPPED